MTDGDLLEEFDLLADAVRHPMLRLDLFVRVQRSEDYDAALEDEPDDTAIAQAMDVAELRDTRRRRGALQYAANLVLDRILDDLVLTPEELTLAGHGRFVDEYLPARFRTAYDAQFLRKMLATAAKVAQDLATPEYTRPACTAEELVLSAILQEWQVLLDLTELGQSWADLSEYLFEDTDFEYLFEAEMDGIENDPLAHKTSGIEVNAVAEWFVPFNIHSVVHPYAIDLAAREPKLYELTQLDADGHRIVIYPTPLDEMPARILGMEPISDLVASARRDARSRQGPEEWIPDETDPNRSFAELAARPVVSGVLAHQTGPDGEITEAPVLSITPHPAHPATGTAWAEVFYLSGRTELPLAAVVSFQPDPTVRERWEAVFRPSK